MTDYIPTCACRAREIREDETGLPVYKPVVDHADDDGGDGAISNGVASGYRRARAG